MCMCAEGFGQLVSWGGCHFACLFVWYHLSTDRCAASRLDDSHYGKVAAVDKRKGWTHGGGVGRVERIFKACETRSKGREAEQVESVRRKAER